MVNYLKLVRVEQYLKNIFIFLPLFFALKITDLNLVLNTFIAFISFCFLASSIYIFNDYCDIEEDKNHPIKKDRPLASGKISKTNALILMSVFLIIGLSISYVLNIRIFYLNIFYLVLNLFYSIRLKHKPIIDVFIISIGFVLRLFVGSVSGNIPLSMWIIIITFLLAIFLALAKRRDDVIIYLSSGIKSRPVIDGYNLEFLNASMIVMVSVVIVSYIMIIKRRRDGP